jgi:dihydroxy-acid dehydratase
LRDFDSLAQVKDGDIIKIDAVERRMDFVDMDGEEYARRQSQWKPPPLKATSGTLYKYIRLVSSASQGCITDLYVE